MDLYYNKYTFIDICTTIHVLVIYSIGEGVTYYKKRAHTYLFFCCTSVYVFNKL